MLFCSIVFFLWSGKYSILKLPISKTNAPEALKFFRKRKKKMCDKKYSVRSFRWVLPPAIKNIIGTIYLTCTFLSWCMRWWRMQFFCSSFRWRKKYANIDDICETQNADVLGKMRKQTKSSHRFRKRFVLDKWHRDRVGFHHMCIASVQIYLHFNSLQKARNHIQLSYILIYSFIGTRCYSFP